MIKYRVKTSSATIERATNEEAIEYCIANNVSPSVIESIDYVIESTIVPKSITPRQFRQALVLKGINILDIESVINAQAEPLKSLAKIELEYSTAFFRDNAYVNQLAPALLLSQAQLDEIWILGNTL